MYINVFWPRFSSIPVFFCLCSPGPSQNPAALQQLPGVNYGMTHQQTYNPMQAKAPAPPGPGLYPSGAYQPVPPVSSYQTGQTLTPYPAPPSQPLLTRPPMGTPPSHTPPQSASPSPGPRLPPAQGTPPPPAVSSSSYYPNPQQPQPMAQAWQYNTAPPAMGLPTSMSAPPRGPVANHMNPAASSTAPPSSAAYISAPPVQQLHSTTQPSGPGMPPTSLHAYTQPGRNTKEKETVN